MLLCGFMSLINEVVDGVELVFCQHHLEMCNLCCMDFSLANKYARIENAKKEGNKNRKLIKREAQSKGCGNTNCPKVENSDVALLSCSGCRRICYCSRSCQLIDWPSHKTPWYLIYDFY